MTLLLNDGKLDKLRKYNLIDAPKENLLSLDELDALEKQLKEQNAPAGKEEATKWAKLLIGAYPSRKMEDTEVFVRSMVFDIQEFPQHVIESAVHKVRRASKFLPTCYEVREACEAFMQDVRNLERLINLQRMGHATDKASFRPHDGEKTWVLPPSVKLKLENKGE